jgi:hypothetical protein
MQTQQVCGHHHTARPAADDDDTFGRELDHGHAYR